ncbi:MAG: aldo/keto reductase [bacterium]|nr:aldo/keto reductase [bacterium]
MKQITLNNNIEMPILGLGTWTLRGDQCEETVRTAIECGYRLIDTAQMYQNEREVGNAIKACGVPREELFITTKICSPNDSYEATKKAIEKSLEELQLDYIDLMLIHEPYDNSQDMYRAMKEAYAEGKFRAIGISNFNPRLYEDFVKECEIIPAVNQVEAHIYHGQKELQETMKKYGTAMEAWSPFTAGKKDVFHNEVLLEIGNKYGKTAAQIILRYFVQRDVIVIPKSSKKERLIENISIFDFELNDEEMKKIDDLDEKTTLFGWY